MLLRGLIVPLLLKDGPMLLRDAQRMVPCCSEDGPLLLKGWCPSCSPSPSQTIIKCDNATAVRCSGALYTDCSRDWDIKVGGYEEHECAPTLTHEEKQAAGLLKRAILLAMGGGECH